MLKKNLKKTMTVLFLGLFLFSGFMFLSPNVGKSLCNINYHPMSCWHGYVPFTF